MDTTFWVFCTFLIILTLIASLGGGVRYRENFIEEVFDTISSVNKKEIPQISDKLIQQTMTTHDAINPMMSTSVVDEEDPMQPPPPPKQQLPSASSHNPVNFPNTNINSYATIEAFQGDMFASF
jgi:hypothetical protein